MKPDAPIKLVSQLLDLPIVDKDNGYCGVVDDVEFSASGAGRFRIEALLVGPGAYAGRLPRWAFALVRLVAGERIARVPWLEVGTIGPVVKLKCAARSVGLGKSEARAERWIPRIGAN